MSTESIPPVTYDNTHALPWLVPALATLAFQPHDAQSMMRVGFTTNAQLLVRWFHDGVILLSHEQGDPAYWHQAYRGRVRNESHLLDLMNSIGWLPDTAIERAAPLTVAQLLDWPTGIGGITEQDFLNARAQLLESGWDALNREQQLIYQLGQEKILGELYAATHAQQKKLIRQLQQQLTEAVEELEERGRQKE